MQARENLAKPSKTQSRFYMDLPPDYYHCYMGNGLDAVLVGYSGLMVPDKVGVDRCAWYKADRYYPEHKLVHAAGRFPMDKPLEHAAGSGWYDLAPLGRAWYEVHLDGRPLQLQSSQQRFVPEEGTLYSELDFGPVQAQACTFLHATQSLLLTHLEFSQAVEVRAWMAPGIWVVDGWDTDPFEQVTMDSEAAAGSYDLGESRGRFYLQLEPPSGQVLTRGQERGLSARGAAFTITFAILDNRQGDYATEAFQQAAASGYDALRRQHQRFWGDYFSHSRITIPDPQFQNFYQASLYHFKAAQNRTSGGLPVNNLRRTWSSHIFWDSYFIQRALLEADRRPEALEGCRFFQRTLEAARRHAHDEFGVDGLKWDWEITHDGRKAYGTLLHMKFQVHNNASYANEIWQYYQFTLDRAYLDEFLPILEGLAIFFMHGIVIQTNRGWEIGPLVGVHESPNKVKNDGISLTGTIAILEHYAEAARVLGKENEFSRKCGDVALGLRRTLDVLYNGQYFASSEDMPTLNMSSEAPIYPMAVVPPKDRRALSTSQAMLEFMHQRTSGNGKYYNFPWAWGVLGTIFARQGEADLAWEIIQKTRPAMCQFGGMTEVMEGQDWNMQYFLTAQGAVVTALHNLLLQAEDDRVDLFPALPSDWRDCSFESLLACGLEVSAIYKEGRVKGQVKNIAPTVLRRTLAWKGQNAAILLEPGEIYAFEWTD
jgi:hypothetical protein